MEKTPYEELAQVKKEYEEKSSILEQSYFSAVRKTYFQLPEPQRKEFLDKLEGLLLEFSEVIKKDIEEKDRKDTIESYKEITKRFDIPLEQLNLSKRTSNILYHSNIFDMRTLVEKTEHELTRYRGMGRVSLGEIHEKLSEIGLALGMNLEKYLGKQNL